MNTSDLNLFICITETGNISASANQLGITPAAASSALKRLEKQLELQLFIRTTRQLRITPQGEKFLFHCTQALQSLQQGVQAAQQSTQEISGEMRLSVPSDLGRNIIFPWLDAMQDKHPLLRIDLTVSDSLSNFFRDQVDVALRYAKPEDSSMVAFHIANIDRVTCASPGYLAKAGIPVHPADLKGHNCLLYKVNGRLFNHWQHLKNTAHHTTKVSGDRISTDTDIIKRWAVAGRGVAYRSGLDVAEELNNGTLVSLLEDYKSPQAELYLLCPSRKQVTPAVIAFREMLREKCAAMTKLLK